MFSHLILGLLRDGRARHGYELISAYAARLGLPVNPGNFYRECSKLAAQGLIAPDLNPPDADPRRIPYRITSGGSRKFDSWLRNPVRRDWPLEGWLVFPERLSADERMRFLEQVQQELWTENKSLVRARETALARSPDDAKRWSAALILLRRIKQTASDLQFLEEVREEFARLPSFAVLTQGRPAANARRAERGGQASGDS